MNFSLESYLNKNPVWSSAFCFYCVPKAVQHFQFECNLNSMFLITLMLLSVSVHDDKQLWRHLYLGT